MTIQVTKPIRRARKKNLTKREIEVLRLIQNGYSSKEAAEKINRSKRTVDFHLANIYDKLNVDNRMKAVKKARSLGFLTEE